MAFSGGGGAKPFTPFTVTAGQLGQQQPAGTGSFTFGSGGTGASGFSFGTGSAPAAAVAPSAPQLSFTAATPAATSTSSLFSFGTATAATPVASVAGLQSSAAPTGGFGFGTPPTNPASAAPTLTAALGSAAPTISFGTPAASTGSSITGLTATATPISFTSAPPAAAANTVQPTFGVPPTTQATANPLIGVATTSAAAPTAAPATGFTFSGGSAPPPVNVTNPIRPTVTTTTAGSAPVAGPPGGAADASSTSAPQLTTATTTTQSSTAVSQMNFRQLQEAINKWMLDLQDQEKVFLEQATKVNAWDRTLISNGDKIAKLNESITKVKNDHGRLEHALDYLKTQQQEFEAFLEPLEAGLPVNIPVEPEREHLYRLTENVDTQLQQMAEDLKEVIRHINESNKNVDKNDPVSQILRILNEHTDALQWVEDNANQVRRSLEDVSKQHQMAKKEHERSLRQMFK